MNQVRRVYSIVKLIPLGKVATYGQIADLVNRNSSIANRITARMVGMALHKNPDPENIPCHRVVDRNGRLAPNFAFDGWREQKRRLQDEGIKFKDESHVNLEASLWKSQ